MSATGILSTEAVLQALGALREAREVLLQSSVRGQNADHLETARRCAEAEGRLIGAVINAVPGMKIDGAPA